MMNEEHKDLEDHVLCDWPDRGGETVMAGFLGLFAAAEDKEKTPLVKTGVRRGLRVRRLFERKF